MSSLAVFGGDPVNSEPLVPFNRIGDEEARAVAEVLRNGELSGFVGAAGPEFDGGAKVLALERAWRERFGVEHAVAMNSATSGLYAAVGAVGVGSGDEVIVPPYTMSATVMAPLVYGATPVFADIEAETFCLDPTSVRAAITDRSRAIIAVNLFGHPARLEELRAIADDCGLALIEDNAQSLLATENGRYAGTVGHIGVFSLNRHKHIQSGEGGVCVTGDGDLALRLRLIRNHGENLIDHFGLSSAANLVGFNYRLTEMSAAIGLCQIGKAEDIVAECESYGNRLTEQLSELPGLTPPAVRGDCRHVYYVWPARFDADVVGVSRSTFAAALAAEGVPVNEGYVEPLYLLPIFQRLTAEMGPAYPRGLCRTCETMHFEEELGLGMCAFELSDALVDRIADAFRKVYENRAELHGFSES